MPEEKILVVLSGGQDSTTCLYYAKTKFPDAKIYAITIDYNQTHSYEIDSAKDVAKKAGVVTHEIIPVGPVLIGSSPLVNQTKKLEQYKDWESLPGGLEKTFVPGRNAMFLVIAMNRAYEWGCDQIFTGVCQEDYGGYPDCRQDFITAMETALVHAADTSFEIVTPLMNLTKAQSVWLALCLPGCFEALAYSHTAYDGKFPPTGKDHATLLRAKGFEQAGVADPLVVRAVRDFGMEKPTTENYAAVDWNQPWENIVAAEAERGIKAIPKEAYILIQHMLD